MKRLFLIISINLFCLNNYGQILNQEVVVFDESPFFDAEWIKNQGIKLIETDISFKKDRQTIRKTYHILRYYFDREGRLIKRQETRDILRRRDTLETHYRYNNQNLLTKIITKDAYGYFALNYTRDASGMVVSESHTREERTLNEDFESLKTIWRDSISIAEKNDSILRVTYFNSYGKPYKDVLNKYDSNNCLTLKREMNRIGGGYSEEHYKRDKRCNILQWNIQGTYSFQWSHRKMEYNQLGLISEESFYTEGEVLLLRRFTYSQNLQLELFLERNLKKKEMRILEFSYEYYD